MLTEMNLTLLEQNREILDFEKFNCNQDEFLPAKGKIIMKRMKTQNVQSHPDYYWRIQVTLLYLVEFQMLLFHAPYLCHIRQTEYITHRSFSPYLLNSNVERSAIHLLIFLASDFLQQHPMVTGKQNKDEGERER